MQNYIFLDLDDTLFQTLRKCGKNLDDSSLRARAYLADGSPISYATHKQQWLWQWLAKDFRIVPVTARNSQAFDRVDLPFREEVILNHGAVILDRERRVDRVWMDRMLEHLPASHEKLLSLWNEVGQYCRHRQGYKPRLVEDFGVTWYGIVKHQSGVEAPLKTLLEDVIKTSRPVRDGSFYWHLNGNNLAVIPGFVNKENAVRYLLDGYRRQHPQLLTFGAGDSLTDAAFMTLCDYALIPRNTQLFNTLAVTE
ncbi:MAG: hydrolase [Gammaproteobacteria bacterium]